MLRVLQERTPRPGMFHFFRARLSLSSPGESTERAHGRAVAKSDPKETDETTRQLRSTTQILPAPTPTSTTEAVTDPLLPVPSNMLPVINTPLRRQFDTKQSPMIRSRQKEHNQSQDRNQEKYDADFVTTALKRSLTITGILAAQHDLSIFRSMVFSTGFDEVLESEKKIITVFAPSNDALQKMPTHVLIDMMTNPEFLMHLEVFIGYHCISGAARYTHDFVDGERVASLEGEPLSLGLYPFVSVNGVPVSSGSNNVAFNGVVHILNDSMLRPAWIDNSVIDWVLSFEDLSTFYSLLVQANFDLPARGTFTLLAPSNEALENANRLQYLRDPKNAAELEMVITFHVINGILTFAELIEGADAQYETFLQNAGVRILTVPDTGMITIENAEIEFADILANNGVVHIISELLLPSTFQGP
jgi:uncharacterized surface protein with fasciclin (FAS1) repeats